MKRFILLTKIVSLMTFFSLGSVNIFAQTTSSYSLITETNQIVDGTSYLIVAEKNSTWNALGYQNSNNRPMTTVTVSNNTITTTVATSNTDQTNPYALVLMAAGDYWNIYDPVNETYLGPAKSGNNNYLKASTADVPPTFEITFTENEANIVCVGAEANTASSPRNTIRLNSGSTTNMFACYTSGSQLPVSLYKLDASTPSTPTLAVSPNSILFNEVTVNQTSNAQTVNISGENLTGNITYTPEGSDASAFNITEPDWNETDGGTLSIVFNPTEAREYSASIAVVSEGAESKTIVLTGEGVSTVIMPVAEFSADQTYINIGQSVAFNDQSTGNPTSWNWTFEGGTPASSTEQNPTIVYSTAGTFAVTLVATNVDGEDSETKTDYITVVDQGDNLVCNGSFENWTTNNKPTCWGGSKSNITAASVVKYSTAAQDGNFAVQLINASTSHKRFTSEALSVTAGKSYSINFWVRGQGEVRTGLYDERESGSGYSTYNEYITVNSTNWTEQTQTVEATNTSDIAEFVFSIINTVEAGDHLQIDNVEIVEMADIPTIIINYPAQSQVIQSPDVDIDFTVSHFEIGETAGKIKYTFNNETSVFVTTTAPIQLRGLENGNVRVTLELVNNDESSLTPAVLAIVDFVINQTGIDTNFAKLIKIYPNPATNYVNVEFPEGTEKISILNMLGQTILEKAVISTNDRINIENLKTGTYFIKIQKTNETEVVKFIIK
ncbi:PKD domain-containing protein [Bacteroidales bacterium OttesenSCG-928-I21]|nr:PKD domain-containing protein [Bacteroidales bacterium OttesenSCG-928-I21]